MRINDQIGLSGVNGAQNTRPGAASTGARFTLDMGVTAQRAEAMAPVSIMGGLEALIAIKSEDNSKERRRRSVRRGQCMLDVLDELKLALLSGHLPTELQNRLAISLREEGMSGDPRLDGIMEGIELRAAVELAKLKQARAAERR